MAHTDRELDRLLARGRLGGPGRDRVLERVLVETAKEHRPRSRLSAWVGGLVAVAAVASGLAVVVLPRAGRGPGQEGAGGLRPKSALGNAPMPAWLDLACSGASLEACPQGATLLFGVGGAARAGYLASYAEPVGGNNSGERVWYFSAETEMPAVVASADGVARLAARGIRIGPEHVPGEYVVHVMLCAQPLGREAILGGKNPGILDRTSVSLKVVNP